MKRFLAVLSVFLMVLTFASCGEEKQISDHATTQPDVQAAATDVAEDVTASEVEENTETVTKNTSEVSNVTVTDVSNEAATDVSQASDPAQWTNEEIVGFYKKAAEKSNPTAKSSQVMVLNKLIINNGEGVLGFFTKILEPAIRSVVKKNALEFDGITGGFHNLSVSDTKSVKAYKSGGYTVVEMTLKNQTDDIHANEYEGTVGHAITVLGDISRVIEQFPQFDVDLSKANIAVNYVNASLKVKINKDGIIEKGTWQYTCDPDISNVNISGITVKTADAEIDYIITVGGGF